VVFEGDVIEVLHHSVFEFFRRDVFDTVFGKDVDLGVWRDLCDPFPFDSRRGGVSLTGHPGNPFFRNPAYFTTQSKSWTNRVMCCP